MLEAAPKLEAPKNVTQVRQTQPNAMPVKQVVKPVAEGLPIGRDFDTGMELAVAETIDGRVMEEEKDRDIGEAMIQEEENITSEPEAFEVAEDGGGGELLKHEYHEDKVAKIAGLETSALNKIAASSDELDPAAEANIALHDSSVVEALDSLKKDRGIRNDAEVEEIGREAIELALEASNVEVESHESKAIAEADSEVEGTDKASENVSDAQANVANALEGGHGDAKSMIGDAAADVAEVLGGTKEEVEAELLKSTGNDKLSPEQVDQAVVGLSEFQKKRATQLAVEANPELKQAA